jgi:hypothetical protein
MGGYVALEIMRQAPERVTKHALLEWPLLVHEIADGLFREVARGLMAVFRYPYGFEIANLPVRSSFFSPSLKPAPEIKSALRMSINRSLSNSPHAGNTTNCEVLGGASRRCALLSSIRAGRS